MSLTRLRHVNLIRFTLPFILFIVVAAYEVWEHWLTKGVVEFNIHLTTEVAFFGIMGPTAVFVALSYIISLLQEQLEIRDKLELLNQNLEQKVAERTEALAARNDELARANAELQKLDQLKSDFVSLVSHELRAPLTNLNGGLELVQQEAMGMPPKPRRILSVMAQESERLTRLVQTILDVSQLDAGKLTLNPGPVAIVPLLKRTVEAVLPDGRRPVIWHLPPGLVPVWADEVYLEEILHNLLTNADKYSPPGKPIELSVNLSDGCMHIVVTDHGQGIPPELQSQIFERFYRPEQVDRITTPGWGLGLYFARALTEAQDGRLTVTSPVHDSDSAPGAAFTITLPVTREVPDHD
ncbi:MAG: sensor histidine kinase [Anaerolineae bacterium]